MEKNNLENKTHVVVDAIKSLGHKASFGLLIKKIVKECGYHNEIKAVNLIEEAKAKGIIIPGYGGDVPGGGKYYMLSYD
ncbi:MAG: hypothetical protein KJ646_02280 [Nanoarchaeota archaeon]|nr:hypothetical protein [Nanoarchaeota archaeon]MBU4116416.1 hypothetical protein [Nanoarchaeota archaeon]